MKKIVCCIVLFVLVFGVVDASAIGTSGGMLDSKTRKQVTEIKERKPVNTFISEYHSYDIFMKALLTLDNFVLVSNYRLNGGISNEQSLIEKIAFYSSFIFLITLAGKIIFCSKMDWKQEIFNFCLALVLIPTSLILIKDYSSHRWVFGDNGLILNIVSFCSFITNASEVGGVQGIFDFLDGGLKLVLDFFETNRPTFGLIGALWELLVCLALVLFYGLMYLQFLLFFMRSIIILGAMSVFAPFMLLFLPYPATRKIVGNFLEKTLYHCVTLVVLSIMIVIIMQGLGVFLAELNSIESQQALLSSEYLYVLFWCMLSSTLLAVSPEIAAAMIPTRGISGGFSNAMAAAGSVFGTAALALGGKVPGLKNVAGGGKGGSGGGSGPLSGAISTAKSLAYSSLKGMAGSNQKDAMGRRSWRNFFIERKNGGEE